MTKKQAAIPLVDTDKCTGCGRCVAACPPHVLWLTTDHPKGYGKKRSELHNPNACTGCTLCERVCPFDAITMTAV